MLRNTATRPTWGPCLRRPLAASPGHHTMGSSPATQPSHQNQHQELLGEAGLILLPGAAWQAEVHLLWSGGPTGLQETPGGKGCQAPCTVGEGRRCSLLQPSVSPAESNCTVQLVLVPSPPGPPDLVHLTASIPHTKCTTAMHCDLGSTQQSPNLAHGSAGRWWAHPLLSPHPSLPGHPFKHCLHATLPNFKTQASTGRLWAPAVGTVMRRLPPQGSEGPVGLPR